MKCKTCGTDHRGVAKHGGYCLNHQEQRAEASEARAAQLETDNDEMQGYINEIRVALHTEKDELTIDAVRRVISERDELRTTLDDIKANTFMPDGTRLSDAVKQVMQERDELARKLEQAQRNISAYDKAERALNQAFNEGDGVYRP